MATRRIGLTKKHYVSFDAHLPTQSTLTAYGKLIEGGESTPAALGVSHPRGLGAALHKSLVFGVQVASERKSTLGKGKDPTGSEAFEKTLVSIPFLTRGSDGVKLRQNVVNHIRHGSRGRKVGTLNRGSQTCVQHPG